VLVTLNLWSWSRGRLGNILHALYFTGIVLLNHFRYQGASLIHPRIDPLCGYLEVDPPNSSVSRLKVLLSPPQLESYVLGSRQFPVRGDKITALTSTSLHIRVFITRSSTVSVSDALA